jgi:hypothetical protein
MDVYDALVEAIDTINSKTITCKGTMVADVVDGILVVGFGLCNDKYFEWNKENRDVLREIGMDRAISWAFKSLDEVEKNIPQSVYMDIYYFCKRAVGYFKGSVPSKWITEMLSLDEMVDTDECQAETPLDISMYREREDVISMYNRDQMLADDVLNTLNVCFKNIFNFDIEKQQEENQGC